MILTHPFLFYSIVVLFIAFTSGWLVYVVNSRTVRQLKHRVRKLEHENDEVRRKTLALPRCGNCGHLLHAAETDMLRTGTAATRANS